MSQLSRKPSGSMFIACLTAYFVWMTAGPAQALEADGPQVPEKVVYKKTVDSKDKPVELQLHIFKPKGWSADDKRPAIVFFFGGGWISGTPQQFYPHSRDLANKGMVAIAAEYRIRSKHGTTPLECVEDGKSAVRYIRANAKQLGVDPDRVVASGGSAGGHVAACTAVVTNYDNPNEDLSVSSEPNLMVLFNPVISTSRKNGYGSKKVPGDDPLIISPLHKAHEKQPPCIVFHGDADTVVKIDTVREFDKRCEALGVVCILVEYKGAQHSFFNHPDFKKPKKGSPNYYELIMSKTVSFLSGYGYLQAAEQ